jgi:hypothetical protein
MAKQIKTKDLVIEGKAIQEKFKKSLNEESLNEDSSNIDGKKWRSNFFNTAEQWITTNRKKFDADVMNLYKSLLKDAKNKFKPFCKEIIGKKYSEIARPRVFIPNKLSDAKIIKAEIHLSPFGKFEFYSNGKLDFTLLPSVIIKMELSDGGEESLRVSIDEYQNIQLI